MTIAPNEGVIRVQDLDNDNGWLRSRADGRYLLLRGVCFGPSAKLAPYLPFRDERDWQRLETYVDLLVASGFTTIRLPFLWAAFEPECDPLRPRYDEQYFLRFFEYVDRFTEKGLLVFIDMHQDLVGRAFGGNGLPDWVRAEGAREHTILANTALWGLNYVLNKDLRRTFTAFWKNDLTNPAAVPPLRHFAVRDRFLDTIERVAERAAVNPHVIGIDIFNEPHPAMINDRTFEEEVLPEFYERAIARIRKYSDDLYAFLSPQSEWNANVKSDRRYESYLRATGDDRRIAFAYHYYDSLLTGLHGLHFHDRKREEYVEALAMGTEQARRKGMVPFLTEFGTRQNWMTSIVRRHMNWQFEAVEQSLTNATYWNVNLYNTARDRDGFMREDFSLLDEHHEPRNLDIAVRPYVVHATSEPVHMHFNVRTKDFELILRGRPLAGATELYVPLEKRHPLQPVHYGSGMRVVYNGRGRMKFDANRLTVALDPELDLHRIRISARDAELDDRGDLTSALFL